MRSKALDRLIEQPGFSLVDKNGFAAFLSRSGVTALFCTGDPAQRPESADLAVILPELRASFAGCFEVGVVDADLELEVQARYGFQQWPTLVFLRNGEYLGHVSRLRDWSVYLQEVGSLLVAEVRRPLSVGVPVMGAN